MRAGLEIHVEGRAACAILRLAQRVHLRVRLARGAVVALADHLAVADDDRADQRIRARPAGRPRGQPERASHVRGVRVLAHGW